jgi:hypothetical protein
MDLQGDLADKARQLWSSYDTAINSACLKPELRLLQVKNDRRKVEHQTRASLQAGPTLGSQPSHNTQPTSDVNNATETDFMQVDMHFPLVDDETIQQPSPYVPIDLYTVRHAQFRRHLELQEERSASLGS